MKMAEKRQDKIKKKDKKKITNATEINYANTIRKEESLNRKMELLIA